MLLERRNRFVGKAAGGVDIFSGRRRDIGDVAYRSIKHIAAIMRFRPGGHA